MARKLVGILVVTMLLFTAAMLWMSRGQEVALPADTTSGKAQVGGAFTLTDQNGARVSSEQFRGRPMLVFFGFTHCPDICPTALATYTSALNLLGDRAKDVAPVFISVDPKRDTPARLKEYLANFHPAIVGLTGTYEEIEAVSKAYKAYYSVVAPEPAADPHAAHGGGHASHGENYMVNHSSLMYLMNRQGEYVMHFGLDTAPEALAAAMREQLP